jgi:nucleoside-diphosphate-sugar epimerase
MEAQPSAQPVVLVTGSASLIGTRAVAALSTDYQVVALDTQPPEHHPIGVDWITCDLTQAQSIAEALAAVRAQYGSRIASVLHLAAYADFSGESRPLPRALVVEGTRLLLRGLQSLHVEQFVFAGSLLVMQPPADPRALIAESSPTEATWDYPRWQLEAEHAVLHERGGMPTVILRIANMYDDDCRAPLLAHAIRQIYEKQLGSYFFPGELTHGQAFVHLDDLSTCVRQVIALRRTLDPYELFLIAEPGIVTYGELPGLVGPLLHAQGAVILPVPKALAKAGAWVQDHLGGASAEPLATPWAVNFADLHYPVAIDHAQEKLGWNPQRSLRDTLPEMVHRLQQNPERWYQLNGLLLDE